MKTKRTSRAPARDLYASTLFRGRRRFVEMSCGPWFILSAKHGLVATDEVISPYEETLNHKSSAEKRQWAASVLGQLTAVVVFKGNVFELHAGAEYRDHGLVDGLCRRGATVEVPAAHLSQGEHLAFYAKAHPAVSISPVVPASQGFGASRVLHAAWRTSRWPQLPLRPLLLHADRTGPWTIPTSVSSPSPSLVGERRHGQPQPRGILDGHRMAG